MIGQPRLDTQFVSAERDGANTRAQCSVQGLKQLATSFCQRRGAAAHRPPLCDIHRIEGNWLPGSR